MIQLNNYQTGAVILIEDIRIKPTGVYYKKYTNPYFKDLNLYAENKRVDYISDSFQSLLINPTFKEFEIDGCIANIIATEEGFVLSADKQCWLTSIDGYDISDKRYRIVANDKIWNHIAKRTELGLFFLRLQEEFYMQYIEIDTILYIYVSSINEEVYPGISELFELNKDTVKIEVRI